MDNNENGECLTFEQYEQNIYFQLLINSLVFADGIGSYMRKTKIDTIAKSDIFSSLRDYIINRQDYNMFNMRNKNNLYFLIDYLIGTDNTSETLKMNEILAELRQIVNQMENNNYAFLCEQYVIREFGPFNFKSNLRKLRRSFFENIMSLEREYYQSINNDYSVFCLLKSSDECYLENAKNFFLAKNFYRSVNYFFTVYPHLFLNLKYFNRVLEIIKNGDCQMDELGLDNVDIDFIYLSNVTKRMVNKFERKNRRIFY